MPANTQSPDRTASPWLTFALVGATQFMVVLDTAIINVALPTIKTHLHFSNSSIQWTITAYVLTFGGFLLFGGRAADLFGRRRILLIGMTSFTVISFLIGINSSPPLLITLRGLQGVAAALMSPAALSIVLVTFRDEDERSHALGYWSMVATGGAAVGLLLGGILTQYLGWRWNFFINVPVGIAVVAAALRLLPAHEPDDVRTSLDLPGAVLVTGGLMAIVFCLSQAPAWGWLDSKTIGVFVAAPVLLAAFVLNERRAAQPLVTFALFRSRNLSGANLMMGLVYAGNLGFFFILTLYLQSLQGYSAIKTGLAFLPFPIILGIVSARTGPLVRRYGFRRFLIVGPSIVGIGLAWLCLLPVHGNYAAHILPPLLVMPIGYGLTFAPMYAAATSDVPKQLSGLASGVISTSQQLGGAVGLAVISGVAASITTSRHHDTAANALTVGYRYGLAVALFFTLLSVTVAIVLIRRPSGLARTNPHA